MGVRSRKLLFWWRNEGVAGCGAQAQVWLDGVAQAQVSGQQGEVWDNPSPSQRRYRKPKVIPRYLGMLPR